MANVVNYQHQVTSTHDYSLAAQKINVQSCAVKFATRMLLGSRLVSAAVTRGAGNDHGWIREMDYFLDDPWQSQQQMLPLLRHLGQQPRWQLWLTPGEKLNRYWLQSSGLPVNKTLQITQLSGEKVIHMLNKALQTGNYSVIIGWLPYALTHRQYQRLQQVAQVANTIVILMQPQRTKLLKTLYRKNNLVDRKYSTTRAR